MAAAWDTRYKGRRYELPALQPALGADELYSKLTVNLRGGGYNQPVAIRADLDAGVAAPEPASMLLMGGGLGSGRPRETEAESPSKD